jgi:hypothetical protein
LQLLSLSQLLLLSQLLWTPQLLPQLLSLFWLSSRRDLLLQLQLVLQSQSQSLPLPLLLPLPLPFCCHPSPKAEDLRCSCFCSCSRFPNCSSRRGSAFAFIPAAGWPILRGLIAKGGLFAPRANRLLLKHRKIVIQTVPSTQPKPLVILSGAKNPCISHLHLLLLLQLPVPAVILNAVKDPEETTQQPPCESFNPYLLRSCLCLTLSSSAEGGGSAVTLPSPHTTAKKPRIS